MKKLFCSVAIVTFSLFGGVAHADFSGQWSGQGKATSSTGWSSPCEMMTLSFQQSATSFSIVSGDFMCGEMEESFNPLSVEIKNNELFAGSEKVGTISDTELHIQASSVTNGHSFNWVIDMTRDSLNRGSLNFKESFGDESGSLGFEGVLKQ